MNGYRGILALLILTSASNGFSANLVAEIGPEGFGALARILRQTVLLDQKDAVLANLQIPSPQGTVSLISPRLTIQFGDLELAPEGGSLRIGVSARNVELRVPRMYIPFGRGVNCYDTSLYVGFRRPVPLTALVGARVDSGNLIFSDLGSKVTLAPDNYASRGPVSCRGLLLGNRIVRNAVARALAKARADIAESLRGQVAQILREAQDLVKRLDREGISLDISSFPGAKPGTLTAQVSPRSLAFTADGARLGVDAKFSRSRDVGDAIPVSAVAPLLAGILVKSEVIQGLLNKAFHDGGKSIVVDPADSEPVKLIFTRKNLAAALPDLELQSLDREELQAAFTFHRPPEVSFLDSEIRICFPSLGLDLRPTVQGLIADYFVSEMGACANLKFYGDVEKLRMSVPSGQVDSSLGKWAVGFSPKNPLVDQAQLSGFFSGVMDTLTQLEPLVDMAWPKTKIGSQWVTLSDLALEPPYLRLTFAGKLPVRQ